ncbi:MAG: flavohemoglobin expression-modulating QEGLA motif protein [Gammaproteobacteria bacterium]|nr:flavohemoglobin expression-modulating QEGLA motif protein [Gammaproteobacteria bacterium]
MNTPAADIEPIVYTVDEELRALVTGIDILEYVNPINLEQEKERFFDSNYAHNPEFEYKDHTINAYEFKEKLYRLRVDDIGDSELQQLYRQVVDSYADKAEQLSSIGSRRFLYNCLRYYGEPGPLDIANAHFILHAPAIQLSESAGDNQRLYGAGEVRDAFLEALTGYGIECPVVITSNMVAGAMVSKGSILINSVISVNRLQLNALIHHELGVHVVTTMNAREQPLQILRNGLPLNTLTQEGLAILSEYFSGNLDVDRLRVLALRVVAVQMLVNGNDFRRIFLTLLEEHGMERERAFKLTARVYRGGGFTKDYLYLRGFRDALDFYRRGEDLSILLVGKTTFDSNETLKRLLERGWVTPPKYVTAAFESPCLDNPVLNYLISAIK